MDQGAKTRSAALDQLDPVRTQVESRALDQFQP
jgi:hypothetical protein